MVWFSEGLAAFGFLMLLGSAGAVAEAVAVLFGAA